MLSKMLAFLKVDLITSEPMEIKKMRQMRKEGTPGMA